MILFEHVNLIIFIKIIYFYLLQRTNCIIFPTKKKSIKIIIIYSFVNEYNFSSRFFIRDSRKKEIYYIFKY